MAQPPLSLEQHPMRAEIDKALESGLSLRAIARTFGVGRTALVGYARKAQGPVKERQHRARGLARKLQSIVSEPIPLGSPQQHLELYERRFGEITAIFDAANTVSDRRLALAADSARGSIQEAAQRLQGFAQAAQPLSIGIAMNLDVASMTDAQLHALAAGLPLPPANPIDVTPREPSETALEPEAAT